MCRCFHAMSAQRRSYRGISRIVYESDKYAHTEATIASKRMLRSAGVELVQLPMPLICRYPEKSIRQYDKKVQAIIGPAFLV